MPKEKQKRGRRALDAHRRRKASPPLLSGHVNKKRKTDNFDEEKDVEVFDEPDFRPLEDEPLDEQIEHAAIDYPEAQNDVAEKPFYGLLDEQAQEYFKKADDMLEVNSFVDEEERLLFLENVYKEAKGKELIMACSQSASRLMERLIQLSTPQQLKALFQSFSGHFLNLIQHRFASHCCETLFIKAAPEVILDSKVKDVINNEGKDQEETVKEETVKLENSEVYVSMENLFLYTINELEGNLGFLLTDRFASHTLRVLLVVLSGQPLDITSSRSVLKSKKKERIQVMQADTLKVDARTVPSSFTNALQEMIAGTVHGLDTTYLRALATHPTGNPTLQLLLQLELTNFGKERAKEDTSLIRRLLPDDSLAEGTGSASFINGIMYEPIGSRLLETIVQYVPGKMFKTIYKQFFKERMGALARNEIAGYVVCKVLERLSKEDLQTAQESILQKLPNLAERGRTTVIKTLIERSAVRELDTKPLATALKENYSADGGITFSLKTLLNLPADVPTNGIDRSSPTLSPKTDGHSVEPKLNNQIILHSAILAQAMLAVAGPLSELVFGALVDLPQHFCLYMAYTPALSPILQKALTVRHATLIFRRKLIIRFYSHISRLARHPSGSHVVDAIWAGTQGMAFARERVAEELAEEERALRDDRFGKKVWQNWQMTMHQRRHNDWVRMVRADVGNRGFLSFPDGVDTAKSASKPHSARTSHRKVKSESVPSTRDIYQATRSRTKINKSSPGTPSVDDYPPPLVKPKSKLDLARERHAKLKQERLVADSDATPNGEETSASTDTKSTSVS